MLSASLNKTFFSLSATFIVKITFVNFAPFVGTTHVCSNKPILNVCVSGQGASVAGVKDGRLYDVRHMVKDHSDSEKGNPLPPHIAHTTAFVTSVVEHWLEREIAQWVTP